MAVSLSDQYVLLLQNVVQENSLLREQLQKSTQETRSCIEEMKRKIDKIDNMSAGAGRRIRQTGPVRAIRVPKLCRNDVRRKLKMLKSHDSNLSFKFDENHDSEHNSMLCSRVSEELAHEYGGAQKCPWSAVMIKEAFKTYFRSSRASNIRSTNGTQKEHVAKCRRRNRKEEKLARRLKQVEMAGYDAQKTARVAEVMKPEYMSSEESEFDESTENKIVKYNVRKLPWESRALRKVKRKLDRLHTASLSDLVQKRVIPREVGEPSPRPKPNDCPEWATSSASAADNADDVTQSLNPSDTSLSDAFNDSLNEPFNCFN